MDGPSSTGAEAIRISSTFLTCGEALLASLGLAGAGLGGGGRLGRGFLLLSFLGPPSDYEEKEDRRLKQLWKYGKQHEIV